MLLKRRKKIGKVVSAATSLFNSRFSYAVMTVTVILFTVFYLQTFFYMILALLIALPFFSYYLTGYVFKSVSVKMHFSSYSCSKGDKTTLEVIINDPSYIPVSCLEITLDITSSLYGGEGSVTHSIQIKPGENILRFPVCFDKYGIYTAKAIKVTAYDPLHLFSFTKSISSECSMTIMPDVKPEDKRHEVIYEEGFDEFTDNSRRGNVNGNVTDIREYQPGDRLSRIHWKLTEKLDKLIVKENEATSSNEFTVLLELYQPSKLKCDLKYEESGCEDDSMYHILDNAIEEAWAVSAELLQAGMPFIFMYYEKNSEDFVSILVNSKEELTDSFTRAFYAGSYDTGDLALSVYERSGLNKGTLIHVKG